MIAEAGRGTPLLSPASVCLLPKSLHTGRNLPLWGLRGPFPALPHETATRAVLGLHGICFAHVLLPGAFYLYISPVNLERGHGLLTSFQLLWLSSEVHACVLFKNVTLEDSVTLKRVIADKNVHVLSGRTLIGHENYPLAVEKDSVI